MPITITVNAESRQVKDDASLADLIADAGLADAPCAAEVNGALVTKANHASTTLHDGDTIELVTLVGGG